MRREVCDERLPAVLGSVVPRGRECGAQRERVPAGRLAQRAGAAQPPARAARQPPRQPLHHARVEEVEHASWNHKHYIQKTTNVISRRIKFKWHLFKID